MRTIKAEGRKDYFYKYMQAHSIQYKFSIREVAVAAEFLYQLDVAEKSEKPIIELDVDDEGNPKEIELNLTPMERVKHPETLQTMLQNLEMSMTVFRKHLMELKRKGFFKSGEVNPKFISSQSYTETFKVKLNGA